MSADRPPGVGSQEVTRTQVAGHLIQIQNVTGNVTVNAGPVVRSAYLEQVRQIAPARLQDRDEELAELADFCARPDGPAYTYWQAAAWAGKSALLSWFALHPPAGVRLVPFFVTGRYAGQGDRDGFTEIVLEQLAELLGQPMPALLTAATRDSHLLGMLALAARASQQRGQRLVLLVDGLDEDRGVTTSPDAHSIAALLPARPAPGTRIIVAGRPHPEIPADVADDHPLRDPAIVRRLTTSARADVVRADLQRELKRLLRGDPLEQDLLGLVTTAGGGLSCRDIAELTGLPEFDIQDSLQAATGRSFGARHPSWGRRGPAQPVYILGHEELQAASAAALGPSRLAGYRGRLHDWADSYRRQGWPAETPEYLLRGYYRMLHADNNVARMVTCAVDTARHDRMLDITGGDSAALAEVESAQTALVDSVEPDLQAVARLAVHRDRLTGRNANIPVRLPAVWADAKNPERGEALARAIADPERQARALIMLAHTVASTDLDYAGSLTKQAEAQARRLPELGRRASLLLAVAEAACAAGDHERATAFAREVAGDPAIRDLQSDRYLEVQRHVLMVRIMAAVAAGRHSEAVHLSRFVEDVELEARLLRLVLRSITAAGDAESSGVFSWRADIEKRASRIDDLSKKVLVLAELAVLRARMGDLVMARSLRDQAVEAARGISESSELPRAAVRLAGAMTATGERQTAATLIQSAQTMATGVVTNLGSRAGVLAFAAEVMAAAGNAEQALTIIREAGELVSAIGDPDDRATELTSLARAAAAAGHLEQATLFARQAEALARAVEDRYGRAEDAAALLRAIARAGDLKRSMPLITRVAVLVRDYGQFRSRTITRPFVTAVLDSAEKIAVSGNLETARSLVRFVSVTAEKIPDQDLRTETLALVMKTAYAVDDAELATTLYLQIEAAAGTAQNQEKRAQAVVALAEAVVEAGDRERATGVIAQAESAADNIDNAYWQVQVLARTAKAATTAGQHDRAAILRQKAMVVTLRALGIAPAGSEDPGQAPEPSGHVEESTAGTDDAYDQAMKRIGFIDMASAVGRPELVTALAAQVEEAALNDPSRQRQVRLLALLAEHVTNAGRYKEAEAIARLIPDRDRQLDRLCGVALAMITAGDIKSAEVLVSNLPDPGPYPQVLTGLAANAEPASIRRLIARALTVWRWPLLLEALALTSPAAIATIADDYLAEDPAVIARFTAQGQPAGSAEPPNQPIRGDSNFERFTDRARTVIVLAQENARALNHSYIGSEHLLLGLLAEGSGIAYLALNSFGMTVEDAREQVEAAIGRGKEPVHGAILLHPTVRKVLKQTLYEAIALGHNYIGTEHLLLGLIHDTADSTTKIVERSCADLGRVRAEVIRLLKVHSVEVKAPPNGTG